MARDCATAPAEQQVSLRKSWDCLCRLLFPQSSLPVGSLGMELPLCRGAAWWLLSLPTQQELG